MHAIDTSYATAAAAAIDPITITGAELATLAKSVRQTDVADDPLGMVAVFPDGSMAATSGHHLLWRLPGVVSATDDHGGESRELPLAAIQAARKLAGARGEIVIAHGPDGLSLTVGDVRIPFAAPECTHPPMGPISTAPKGAAEGSYLVGAELISDVLGRLAKLDKSVGGGLRVRMFGSLDPWHVTREIHGVTWHAIIMPMRG